MANNFRNKSFAGFIQEQGIPAIFWVMFIFGFLLSIGIAIPDLMDNQFPEAAFYLPVLIAGLYLFYNFLSYDNYKQGNKIINQESYLKAVLVENMKIYIKNFDLLSSKSVRKTTSKPIYDFDEADLLIKENAFMLLGKGESIMGRVFVVPIELLLFGKPTFPNYCKIETIQDLTDGRIELSFTDQNYSKPIQIVMEPRPELIKWLNKYYANNLK